YAQRRFAHRDFQQRPPRAPRRRTGTIPNHRPRSTWHSWPWRRSPSRARTCLSEMTATENPQSAIRNPQSDTVVAVRGLTKIFKDFWGRPKARAVDNVDFEVRRGEVFGLFGPNGSGKSTTVKLLLGLLYPTKGHIEVFGHSPRHVQTKSRIGYLP